MSPSLYKGFAIHPTLALIRACPGSCYRGIRLHGGMEVPVNTGLGRDLMRSCLGSSLLVLKTLRICGGGGVDKSEACDEHTHTTVYKICNWGFPCGPVARTPGS